MKAAVTCIRETLLALCYPVHPETAETLSVRGRERERGRECERGGESVR